MQPVTPPNIEELQQSLVQEWINIPQAFIRNYVLSLELEVVTPDISWTKLFLVDGLMYTKVTCDKMSPLCDFILILL